MPLLPSHTLLQAHSLTLVGSSYLLLFNPLVLLNASPLWLLGESMHIRRASFLPSRPNLSNIATASAPGVTLQGKKSLAESILGGSALLNNDIREVLALVALVLFLAAVTQTVLVSPLRYSKDVLLGLAQKSRKSRHGAYSDENATSEFAEKIHTLHTAQTLFMTVSALRVVCEGALVAYVYLLYADRSHTMGVDIGTRRYDEAGVMGLLANRVVFALGMADMLFWGYLWTVLRDEARDVAEVLSRRRKIEDEDRD